MRWYNRVRLSWKLTAWMLYVSLAVSLGTLVIYFIDFNFNDTTLFVLLVIIRYSSFILCVCALYKLILNIYHFVRKKNFKRAVSMLSYMIIIVYGIVMLFLEALIVAMSKGS